MPDPSPSTLSLNSDFLQLGRRSGGRPQRTVYPRRLPVNCDTHCVSGNRTHSLPIVSPTHYQLCHRSVGKLWRSCWLRCKRFILQSLLFVQLLTGNTLVLAKRKIFLDKTLNRRTGNARYSLDFSRAFMAVRFVVMAIQISSLTSSMFASVLADFGRLLPGFLAVVPCRSIIFMMSSINRRFQVFLEILLSYTLRAQTFPSTQIPNQTTIVRN